MTSFIAIASGKGGVGKTSTAINLGIALTHFGKDVVVVDADLAMPNVAVHLGSPSLPVSINDALEGKTHITSTAFLHPSGLKIIPASIAANRAKNSSLKNFPNVMLDLSGTADIVIVDTGAVMSADTLAALASTDKLLIVTNPEMPALTDALKTIALAEEQGCEIMGVVVNRATGENFEVETKNVEALLDREVIGVIPEDSSVKKAIALKHPVLYTHPDSPASIAFKKLAARILGQEYIPSISGR
ncbi:MAG TPA: cell division ATPase MinD [Candidatus Nanoarchaeia archaeon]|nr:cell division ATPase MinD [Candidatus Nanoarchaeia archaeon]